jgi:hypothetical protein
LRKPFYRAQIGKEELQRLWEKSYLLSTPEALHRLVAIWPVAQISLLGPGQVKWHVWYPLLALRALR